jgi:hypothetical protein
VNADELFAGLRRADYDHDGGVRCLRRLRLEPEYLLALRREVERLCASERGSDVSDTAHPTHWTMPRGTVTQYSLLNPGGRFDDTSSDHDLSCRGKAFRHAAEYPVLGEFVAAFPHAVNCRINVLGPGAGLSPHEENAVIRTRDGRVAARLRLHLPVVTNPLAVLILDGDVYHLEAGTVHVVNNGCIHSARNDGPSSRIHVVMDLLLTEQVFARVFGDAPWALPLRALDATEETLQALRIEPRAPHVRVRPQVRREEARAVDWCPVQ